MIKNILILTRYDIFVSIHWTEPHFYKVSDCVFGLVLWTSGERHFVLHKSRIDIIIYKITSL